MRTFKIVTVNTNTIGDKGSDLHCANFKGANAVEAKQAALDERGDYSAIVSCVEFNPDDGEERCKVDCFPDGENEDNRFDD